MELGAVLVDLSGMTDRESICSLISRALTSLPDGRNLVVMWEQDTNWGTRLPIEAWVTQAILGLPLDRGTSKIDFFGNGIVRVYEADSSSPSSSWQWLSFRRTGERAYARRKTASHDIVDASTMSTLDPVFTRDAANNVWHLSVRSAQSRIIERFQVLLTWSDEETLVLTDNSSMTLSYPNVSFTEGLIGVASKTPYSWQ